MSKLLLASILSFSFSFSFSSTALADAPTSRTACPIAKSTKSVFSMRTLPKRGSSHATSTTFDLYSNGAWVAHTGGPNPKSAQGCLDGAKQAAVKRALEKATWKTTNTGIACEAIAFDYTEYLMGSKVVLRRELCDAVSVDRVTEKALADVMTIVNPLISSAR